EHVYEQDFDRDSNLIEVYISRLREKLGKQAIETRRGQGYIYVGIET
ncbi:MAG: helix-turn-helix domain-containing protein, partial [Candidatus Thiodiazotropha taylori]